MITSLPSGLPAHGGVLWGRAWATVFRTRRNSPNMTMCLVKLAPSRKKKIISTIQLAFQNSSSFGFNEDQPNQALSLSLTHRDTGTRTPDRQEGLERMRTMGTVQLGLSEMELTGHEGLR